MALEVRYVPMVDEGDKGYPQIMRVIYNEQNVALSYEPCTIKEAQDAQPDCVEPYFNLVRDYLTQAAAFFDANAALSTEVLDRMNETAGFCLKFVRRNMNDVYES
jgi:hypothetical protein